jgi:hypothetical protein
MKLLEDAIIAETKLTKYLLKILFPSKKLVDV